MLHQSRTKADAARERRAAGLLERLNRNNCFYATPFGSNDDWYWLYAAVKSGNACRSLSGIVIAVQQQLQDLMITWMSPALHWCSYHTD